MPVRFFFLNVGATLRTFKKTSVLVLILQPSRAMGVNWDFCLLGAISECHALEGRGSTTAIQGLEAGDVGIPGSPALPKMAPGPRLRSVHA